MSKKRRAAERAGRRQKNMRRSSKRSDRNGLGVFFIILQTIASLAFMGVVVLLDMLPMRYLALVGLVLFFLWCITFTSQMVRKKKGTLGKLFSIVMVCVLSFGTFYVAKTNNIIAMITGGSYQIDKMVVAVRADDAAEALEDAVDYNFGVQFARGGDNMQAAVTDIQDELGSEISTVECSSVQEQAQALMNGQVDAIIYNKAYTDLMDGSVSGYSDDVRIIYEMSIRVELNFGGSGDSSLTKKPFTVYISGNDQYGDIEISDTGRSDVNIIAVVNPTTHQILLVTTPRDYYVEIPGESNGQKDKLTHAGIYGVDASIATLSQLYETDINYYVKLNFTSLIDIVDILGGVDVNSEFEFTTGDESGCIVDVKKGYNHFNGEQALAFSRERHNLADGDNQRGKNQQAVITAMIKKMLSPTMLLKANSILNQVGKDVDMNVSQSQINSLIRYQLNTNAKWTIKSVAAEGTGSEDYCYSDPSRPLYVTLPDYDSVNSIIDLINTVEEGGSLPDTEALN